MNRYSLFALSGAIAVFSACKNIATQEARARTRPLVLKDVDYVLDGGSVYVELKDSESAVESCLFVVCPDSPIIERYFPHADQEKPVVIIAPNSDEVENGRIATNERIGEIIDRLSVRPTTGVEPLTESVLVYLRQIHEHGRIPYYWGSAAVDSLIENGRGKDCFDKLDEFPLPDGY